VVEASAFMRDDCGEMECSTVATSKPLQKVGVNVWAIQHITESKVKSHSNTAGGVATQQIRS